MSRYIDADALKDELLSWAREITNPKRLGTEDSIYIIDCAPTVDAVPVVRCRECKHRTELCGVGWHPCTDMAVNNNWYCADGERKDDA